MWYGSDPYGRTFDLTHFGWPTFIGRYALLARPGTLFSALWRAHQTILSTSRFDLGKLAEPR
jgi:hypothetical protein